MSEARAARTLAVCADDFGLSPGVSRGIAALAHARRVNAISCLANMPRWRRDAALLDDVPASVDLGLHFNLTEGEPLSAELRDAWPRLPALWRLIAGAHLGAIPREAIAAEFAAQHRAFVEATGRQPDFIDGHQHVHHLPGLRDVVLDAVLATAPRPAVRNTGRLPGRGFGIKRGLIAGTGGRALQRELARRGIAHNAALLGVYDFRAGGYRRHMQGWLSAVPADGAVLFCHPGSPDESPASDPIAGARGPEADYLRSDAFADDLRDAGVVLGSAWRRLG
jgi:chitin disaccharide deacetylase